MKSKKTSNRIERWVIVGLVLAIVFRISLFIGPRFHQFIEPYYTDTVYKNLASLFGNSQYRQKNPTSLIPDETVFSYASGAYIRGVDPILVNSEHAPLGKYIIGGFIYLFKNDQLPILIFSLLTLVAMYLLAREVLASSALALIPVAFLAFEPLFLNQLRYVPLLDIVQLPFILLAMWVFLKEQSHGRFIATSLLLGVVAATKTVVPSILLVSVFTLVLLFYRKFTTIVRLVAWLPLGLVVFLASYTRTFMDGYSFRQFLGFQKWIFMYQKSKLLFPFSAWRLLFFNQWQAWWGDYSILHADDWQITWGLSVIGTLGFAWSFRKKLTLSSAVLFMWACVYAVFLSLGVVSSRFFLPFFPVTYILATAFFVTLIEKARNKFRYYKGRKR